MDQYRDQPQHLEKIAYQQKLLQEDLVHIRAEISRESTVRRGCGGWQTLPCPHSSTSLLHSTPLRWAGQGATSPISQAVVELLAKDRSLGVVEVLQAAS